jgi:hypothetical protein
MEPRKAHSSWCAKHDKEYHQRWAVEHPEQCKAQQRRRTRRSNALKKNEPAAYRALLDQKNAAKRASRARLKKK